MSYPKTSVKKSFAGKGLFAEEDIKKGKIILQYIGRTITNAEADKNPNRYIFELNEKFSIDGSPLYNKARYANHSCKPNGISAMYKSKGDKIFFEARKDIKKGEEITIDYGEEYTSVYIKKGNCKCFECMKVS
jgi:SET domain-containing protein